MVLPIQAHLANMANPGSFDQTVRELMKLNNLLDIVLPGDASSFEIFRAINGMTAEQVPEVRTMSSVAL